MKPKTTYQRRREQRLQAEEFGRMQRRQARRVAEAIAQTWALCGADTPRDVRAAVQSEGDALLGVLHHAPVKPH